MTIVQVDGCHIRGRRIEGEIRVEPIARLKYELPSRLYTGGWLDRVMYPVEAVWIIFAVLARLCQDQWRWTLDVAGIGQRDAPAPDKKLGNHRHSPNEFGFHWMSSLKNVPARFRPDLVRRIRNLL
jgi:hypothetical protein